MNAHTDAQTIRAEIEAFLTRLLRLRELYDRVADSRAVVIFDKDAAGILTGYMDAYTSSKDGLVTMDEQQLPAVLSDLHRRAAEVEKLLSSGRVEIIARRSEGDTSKGSGDV